ncbi:MAG: hypothetical protein J6J79_04915 [Lachnospiraceae bacterium]|nr:hypothetical protein [Lachnospiraceae bacterium]
MNQNDDATEMFVVAEQINPNIKKNTEYVIKYQRKETGVQEDSNKKNMCKQGKKNYLAIYLLDAVFWSRIILHGNSS